MEGHKVDMDFTPGTDFIKPSQWLSEPEIFLGFETDLDLPNQKGGCNLIGRLN